MPLTIGGKENQLALDFAIKWSDKVSINSIVYSNQEIINKAAKKFGSQCVVVSVDLLIKIKIFFYITKKK